MPCFLEWDPERNTREFIQAMPEWARPVALFSPLTYVVELLRVGTSGTSYFSSPWIPGGATLAFLVASWMLAGPAFRKGARR